VQGLWDWLITDAGAGWVLGLIGVVATFYAWRKQGRPTRVVVREIETIRLLDIHPSQHESVRVLYPNAQGTQTSITNLEWNNSVTQLRLVSIVKGSFQVPRSHSLMLLVGASVSRKPW
jgi:hypothetical protein